MGHPYARYGMRQPLFLAVVVDGALTSRLGWLAYSYRCARRERTLRGIGALFFASCQQLELVRLGKIRQFSVFLWGFVVGRVFMINGGGSGCWWLSDFADG